MAIAGAAAAAAAAATAATLHFLLSFTRIFQYVTPYG